MPSTIIIINIPVNKISSGNIVINIEKVNWLSNPKFTVGCSKNNSKLLYKFNSIYPVQDLHLRMLDPKSNV